MSADDKRFNVVLLGPPAHAHTTFARCPIPFDTPALPPMDLATLTVPVHVEVTVSSYYRRTLLVLIALATFATWTAGVYWLQQVLHWPMWTVIVWSLLCALVGWLLEYETYAAERHTLPEHLRGQ